MANFNATVDRYKALLANSRAGGIDLANENLGVGEARRVDQALPLLHGDRVSGNRVGGTNKKVRSPLLLPIAVALPFRRASDAKRQVNRKRHRQSTGGAKMAGFQASTE
jgi:hypothetical protein